MPQSEFQPSCGAAPCRMMLLPMIMTFLISCACTPASISAEQTNNKPFFHIFHLPIGYLTSDSRIASAIFRMPRSPGISPSFGNFPSAAAWLAGSA